MNNNNNQLTQTQLDTLVRLRKEGMDVTAANAERHWRSGQRFAVSLHSCVSYTMRLLLNKANDEVQRW